MATRLPTSRITFEYALIAGVNDTKAEAEKLASRLLSRSFKCHVNLIPVNSIDEKLFTRSSEGAVRQFQDMLIKKGVVAAVRRSLGAEINAACGQLRLGEA